MRIGHLSDLHVSDRRRYPRNGFAARDCDRHSLKLLRGLLGALREAEVDHLVVTGDLTLSSEAETSAGVCAEQTGHSHGNSFRAERSRVPSENSILPSAANFAYEAESNMSHPSSANSGNAIGWPAPKAWTGLAGVRPFLADATAWTRSANLYDSISGTIPPTG